MELRLHDAGLTEHLESRLYEIARKNSVSKRWLGLRSEQALETLHSKFSVADEHEMKCRGSDLVREQDKVGF